MDYLKWAADHILIIAAAIITLLGAFLPLLFNRQVSTGAAIIEEIPPPVPGQPKPPMQSSTKLLWGLAALVLLFGIYTAYHYWGQLRINQDAFIFSLWLFVSMIAGMVVQVLVSNYHAGKTKLGDVTASQLLFPLLFSVIVYYPVWAVAASGPKSFYALYAAFLNGYFWENIVSKAKPITP